MRMPMHPSKSNEVTIRNHRFTRWSSVAGLARLVTFMLAACGLLGLETWLHFFALIVVGSFIGFVVAIGLGPFSPYTLHCLKLTDELEPRPGGVGYLPSEIARIDFASDRPRTTTNRRRRTDSVKSASVPCTGSRSVSLPASMMVVNCSAGRFGTEWTCSTRQMSLTRHRSRRSKASCNLMTPTR